MKAAVFKGIGQPLAVEDVRDPSPREDEVVVQIGRCGICGSDLHMTEDPVFAIKPGNVLGHDLVAQMAGKPGNVVGVGKSGGANRDRHGSGLSSTDDGERCQEHLERAADLRELAPVDVEGELQTVG